MPTVEQAKAVYEAANTFRVNCLEKDGSLFFDDAKVWTTANLKTLKEHFNDNADFSDASFFDKLKKQLEPVSTDVVRLAAEVLTVYYLFSVSVTERTKLRQVQLIASWKDLKIDSPVLAAFAQGVGGTGQAYNQRRPEELWFVIEFGLAWKTLEPQFQAAALQDADKFQKLMDAVDGADRRMMRHILLHLLFPDDFEPIASGSHKRLITDAFSELVADPAKDRDARIRQIRAELQKYVKVNPFNFYRSPVRVAWNPSEQDDGYAATDALHYKKQIILYGPPGTGKTHWAKERSGRLIRTAALKLKGPKWYFENEEMVSRLTTDRVHRVQLHPGYSYEDFIRGLHVGAGGQTEYRPGYLLVLVESIEKEKKDAAEFSPLPHVLILDEINRTDLSRLLGECFSLLEDRDTTIELPGIDKQGQPMRISLPSNLYVIGTMNLIDQSLEQIDFALRRRFFWVEHGFERDVLVAVCRARWEEQDRKPHTWDRVANDFDILAEAAADLNDAVRSSRHLGAAFEIGHTYFFDAVHFLERDLDGAGGGRKFYMWSTKGAREAVENLWKFSLAPLLREYLRGLEERERQAELERLKFVFFDHHAEAT
jgi:5-methylcytosine-specific restriction protein B